MEVRLSLSRGLAVSRNETTTASGWRNSMLTFSIQRETHSSVSTSLQRTKGWVPSMSLIQRFHYVMITQERVLLSSNSHYSPSVQ